MNREEESGAVTAAEEEENVKIGKLCREQLVWAEKLYDEDPMGPWINGYRTALRTVLRHVNRNNSEAKLKEEYNRGYKDGKEEIKR